MRTTFLIISGLFRSVSLVYFLASGSMHALSGLIISFHGFHLAIAHMLPQQHAYYFFISF